MSSESGSNTAAGAPSTPFTTAMKYSDGMRELLQGGIQGPGEGYAQQRDIVFDPQDYAALSDLLGSFAAIAPTGTNATNAQAQIADAVQSIDALISAAAPVPFPAGSANYADASYPPATTSLLNVTVQNVANGDGSVDVVIQKIGVTSVENYPAGTTFPSPNIYESFRNSNPPEVSQNWTVLFPDPASSDVISLPEFTVSDTTTGVQYTPGYSTMTGQGSTTVATPPQAVDGIYESVIETAASDEAAGKDPDPTDSSGTDPFSSDSSGGDPVTDDDPSGEGGSTGNSTNNSDPDQMQPDPDDPVDDDG